MKVALVAHGDNPPYLKDLFKGEGFELIEKECNNEKEYVDLLKDADGALIYLHPFPFARHCIGIQVVDETMHELGFRLIGRI